MSLQNCEAGSITGFPIKVIQNIFNPWPGVSSSDGSINKLIGPIDFTVNWAPATTVNISVTSTPTIFQINGLDSVANGTTLTYGKAIYNCSPIMSLIQSQHKNLAWGEPAVQELIQAFQITNKSINPSAPDVILFCRPVIITSATWAVTPFWKAVNASTKNKTPQSMF